jgi:polyisoprenyl-teichoic acid--peptidoglycan teichoic acid transferase
MHNFKKIPSQNPTKTIDGFVLDPRIGDQSKRVSNTPHQLLDSYSRHENALSQPLESLASSKSQRPTQNNPQLQNYAQNSILDYQPKLEHAAAQSFTLPKFNKKPRLRFRPKLKLRPMLFVKFFGFAVFAVILSYGFVFGKAWLTARGVLKGGSEGALALNKNVDPSLLKQEGDGRVNILVLGKGGADHEGGELTDTIMMLSVDPKNNDAAILSIPRDLYVRVPSKGSMKLNAVYETAKQDAFNEKPSNKSVVEFKNEAEKAGLKRVEQTLEGVLGVPINYYMMVDFTAFKKAINTVGGLEFYVNHPIDRDYNFIGQYGVLNVPKGMQKFDGDKAIYYVRSRYTDADGDYSRTARQRELIIALKEKFFSVGTLSNPLKLSQLINDFGDNVQTNISLNELLSLYDIGKNIESKNIKSYSFHDGNNPLTVPGNISGISVEQPELGLNNYKDIQKFVRTKLRDGYLATEKARIVVLNATDIGGLASQKAKDLESYGYEVVKVGDAPKKIAKTVVVDQSNQLKYTKRYLELRMQTTAISAMPDGFEQQNADFVIILGQDAEIQSQN